MRIEENPALVKETLELLKQEYMGESRTGLSLTTLLYCLTKAWKDQHEPVEPTDKELHLWSVGFGLERVLIQSRMVHEVWVMDGVTMHPDFLALDGVLADLKTTRAGPKPPTFETYGSMWLRQFQGYARYKIKQAELAGEVIKYPYPFDVLTYHLIQAEMKAWRFWFDEAEIERNWEYVQLRKQVWEYSEASGIMPEPYQWNEDWECKDCRYALGCQLWASLKKANSW
jgi:hypothetical protein